MRWVSAWLLLLAMAAFGLLLSGYITRLLLQVGGHDATWWVYVEYLRVMRLPRGAPYAGRIAAAGIMGFGLPALAYLALLALVFRPRGKSLHGDARFATAADLSKQGLFNASPSGIVVGRFGRRLVRLPGQQFVILAAPTRSGKGVGIVVPNLLAYDESVVVLDIKQENFELTSGWRASQGHAVHLFNPFAEDRRTQRWNPLTYVSEQPALRISDLMGIAAMLYPDGAAEQKFWISHARNAFLAFSLYLFENRDDERRLGFPLPLAPTLGGVHRLSSGDGGSPRAWLEGLMRRPFLGQQARTAFANLLSQADETFASIMGTFSEPLNAWINPVLDDATSGDDFDLSDLRRKKMSIYIGIPPHKLAESRLIVNLFFSQLVSLNTRTLPRNDASLKYQCLLLMDEFTAIGKVDAIADAVAYMAGYNLRMLPIIQSMAQLDAVYGKDVSRTMITNHAMQIVFAPREQQDANDYSEMMGYTTLRRRSRSVGPRGDATLNETEERRALMLPQELKAMGPEREAILHENLPHPILCRKIRYYDDPYFAGRLLPKVDIRALRT